MFPRLALFLCGMALCIPGVYGAFYPEILSGAALLEPDSITSIRIDFGAFHLGLGLFCFYGVFVASFLKPSLVAVFTTVVLVVFIRIVGLAVDGVNDMQIELLLRETVPLVLSFLGLIVLHKNATSGQ